MQITDKTKHFCKEAVFNFFQFVENLLFIYIFMYFFGSENILPAVSLGVAFTMFPYSDLQIKPGVMFGITIVLFTMGGCIAQLAYAPLWLAAPCYFGYLIVLILLSHEPEMYKPSISFLINFVFCQSTPVSHELFMNRFLCLFLGSIFVGGYTYVIWKLRGYGKEGRGLREQISLCSVNKSYLFRMAFGVSFAMLVGSALQLKKPLWISIVVMSLTQLEFSQTLERIQHRFIGTMIGVVIFFVFFQLLIPKEYAAMFVLMMGYISFFMPQYKYKSIINAISALNASLVLLDTRTAILNRITCLLAGIVIVLAVAGLAYGLKKVNVRIKTHKNISVYS